jgi:2',3'-cyclic-nucleotide 2'-phosphodiesterase/3'-nucleotidase
VSRRDVAGLYIYENFLFAVRVTGQQLQDYLEYSMRYFKQVTRTGPFAMSDVTNASYTQPPTPPIPQLRHDRRSRRGPHLRRGHRSARRTAGDEPRLRRAAGGGGPAVRSRGEQLPPERGRRLPGGEHAPVIYSNSIDIRQLIINWVSEHHLIDPMEFASFDWRPVSNCTAITVT